MTALSLFAAALLCAVFLPALLRGPARRARLAYLTRRADSLDVAWLVARVLPTEPAVREALAELDRNLLDRAADLGLARELEEHRRRPLILRHDGGAVKPRRAPAWFEASPPFWYKAARERG